ncbi:MAG: hypothetical protein M3R62_12550 [Acidobacteriota bacterium]|nr:hypothetical protein [Acidobacteriota bacterium]
MTGHRFFSAGCAAAALLCGLAPSVAGSPTPTPTPASPARLSGGFGRAPSAPRDGEPRSLADAVRAARRRKEQKEQKAVAITNDSLIKDPKQGHVSTSRIQPAAPPPAAPPAARIGKGESAAAPVAPASPAAGEEAVWRERARSLQRRADEFKTQIARLEAETKQLEGDFYRWDDGQYRDRVIKPAWDKKREELETARIQGKQAEADLADLPEKARRAGVPPGWLRE